MERQYPEHGHVYLEVIDILTNTESFINYGGMHYIAKSVQQLLGTNHPVKHEPIYASDFDTIIGVRLFLELPNNGSNHRKVSKKLEAFEKKAKKDLKSALPFFKSFLEFDTWLIDAIAARDDIGMLKQMGEYPRIVYDALIFDEIDPDLDATSIAQMIDEYMSVILFHINQAFLECYGWMPISSKPSVWGRYGRRFPFPCAYVPPSCISDVDNSAVNKFFQRGLTTFKMVGETFVEGRMDQINIDDDDEWLADVVTLVQRAKVQMGK